MLHDADKCIGCGYCIIVCPNGAIARNEDLVPTIDPNICTDCGTCARHCPGGALR